MASRAHLPDTFDTSRFDAAWRTTLLGGDPFWPAAVEIQGFSSP